MRDFGAAREWYERLLGPPAFFPHATEAVWRVAENRSIYVVEHAEDAGHGVVTIFVDDLDAQVAAIAARGLEPVEQETYANGVRRRSTATPMAMSWDSAVHRSAAHERRRGHPGAMGSWRRGEVPG